MQKAPDAFRTISEVAKLLEVPQHVLRFWETRFSQIRPMKRAGGRRYYRPQDVDLLRGIRKLLYDEGYTIKGVQKILREHGVAHVIAIGRGEVEATLAVVHATVTADVSAPALATDKKTTGGAGSAELADSATVIPAAAAGDLLSGTVAAGLSQAERALLQAALEELEKASQLLEKALSEPPDSEEGGREDI